MCATDILQHCRSYMVYTASVSQQSYSVRTSRICQLGYADYATRVALLPQPFVSTVCRNVYCGLCLPRPLFYLEASLQTPLWIVCLIIFVLAWIGQFYGHKVEGKKPSFLKDIQFLLIGPAWLMHFIFKKLGIPY